MNADEPALPPRAGRLGHHLPWWMLSALPIMLLLLWWAGGLRSWKASASGFSDRPVSFDFRDTGLEDALAVLRPGIAVHFSEPSAEMAITFRVQDMPEQQALSWIAQLTETTIDLEGGGIEVMSPPLLERTYRWMDEWTRRHGVRLWPNR